MTKLGIKQASRNSDWLETMAAIEQIVPFPALQERAGETLERIRKATDGRKTAYAWSAGKDSLVLGHLCEQAGITDSMIAVCNLEYPAFMAWVEGNKPQGCQVMNSGQDLTWLQKHPNMLFPRSSALTGRWFSIVQHKLQTDYFRQQGLDMLLLGRRRADGNYTGQDGLYTNGKGITRFSPLYDWPHEDILAYIHYHHDDQTGDIYGTVTHNRARGTHLLEPMKAIVKRLMDEGKEIREISKQLGMRPEEVFRLSDFDKEDFLKMMTKGTSEYSNAEILRKL